MSVDTSPEVDHGGHAGTADGHVGGPRRHGRPKVSETTTATSTPRRARRPWRMRRAERSGSTGKRAARPRARLDRSTPALAHTKPCAVSVMSNSLRRRSTRTASPSTSRRRASASSGSRSTTLASALDTTFWVTTTTSPSASTRPRTPSQASATKAASSSPACTSGRPSTGRISRDLTRSCLGPDGSAAARGWCEPERRPQGAVHDRGGDHTAHARRLHLAGTGGIGLVDHQGPRHRSVEAGHPHHRRLVAQLAQQPIGRSPQGGPGHDGRDGHHVVAPGGQSVGHACDGQHRGDGHHRVRRGDDHSFGRGQGSQHAGAGAGRFDPGEADASHGHGVAASHEVLLEADLGRPFAGQGDPGLDGILRHGQQRRGHTPGRAHLGRHPGQARALAQAARAVEVGGQIGVAQAEPGATGSRAGRDHVGEAGQGVDRPPRLAGQAPAPPGVDRAGQRVGEGVQVGTHPQAVEPDVVTGVDHGGDLLGRHHLDQAGEETGRPHPSGEDRDHEPAGVPCGRQSHPAVTSLRRGPGDRPPPGAGHNPPRCGGGHRRPGPAEL